MKPYGYVVNNGYRGFIPSLQKYLLFDTEDEYVEYFYEIEMEKELVTN